MKALESAGLHVNSQFSRILFSPLYDIVGVVKVFFVCFWGKQLLRWWERGQGRRFLAFILTLEAAPHAHKPGPGTKLRRSF
jgi:hypothetical protein